MSCTEKLPVTTEEKKRPFIEPGWYMDLDNEAYHGSFGFSSSQIKTLIEQTPAHLRENMGKSNAPTPNMMLGTAVHTLVLEPETFDEEFIIEPKFDKRTKIGKAAFAEFEQASAGKNLITEVAFDKAKAMADSVMSHPVASVLLQDIIPESSVFWWHKSMDPDDDTEYKIMQKVRPDAICRSYPVLLDLKTTKDGSYTGFIKSIQNYYYHVSAAMYLEGVNQCKPLLEATKHFAYNKFVFICVESEAPYLTSIYELDPAYLEIGKLLYRHGLINLRNGQENEWPGFPEDIRMIEPPPWANRGFIV